MSLNLGVNGYRKDLSPILRERLLHRDGLRKTKRGALKAVRTVVDSRPQGPVLPVRSSKAIISDQNAAEFYGDPELFSWLSPEALRLIPLLRARPTCRK